MDPQFEELASRLTKDISFKVDEAMSAAEERIDLRFSRRLEEATNELKQHARFDREELKQHAQSNLEELKHQAQLNQEELKDRIAMAAPSSAHYRARAAFLDLNQRTGGAPADQTPSSRILSTR